MANLGLRQVFERCSFPLHVCRVVGLEVETLQTKYGLQRSGLSLDSRRSRNFTTATACTIPSISPFMLGPNLSVLITVQASDICPESLLQSRQDNPDHLNEHQK